MYKPKTGKSFADTQPDMIKEWSDKNEYFIKNLEIVSLVKIL